MGIKRMLRQSGVAFLKLFPAKTVLRFLFWLDKWLYFLQGQMATVYDGGQHTKHRHMDYHRFFVGRVKEGDRVLDIGCGQGGVAHDVAAEGGAEVLGIDFNEKSIAKAKEIHAHPRVTYQVGDALKLLPERPFDLIILSNVLEHLPGRPAFLREVAKVSGAKRFLIRVPLFERDWRVPLKKELGVEWRLDPTHEIEYTLESFAEEMDEAGLQTTHLEVRWGEIWSENQVVE